MLRDEAEYERWRDASRSSLRMVGLAAEAGEHAIACFHAEQAAQLAIKALLHGLGAGDRAFAHSLVALGKAIEEAFVFGSVARGDFNLWSDVDLLVVAGMVPDRFLDRLDALGRPTPRVEPIVWTPVEWREQARRRNPVAVEAVERGVWLVGSMAALANDATR